ncbi:diphosphoinositol-polyphosphate diphosphatase [Sarracenia purpurea var. burkii]
MEFASLGLLAIAFVSISSPDDEMRKLGYEVLGRFRNALEATMLATLAFNVGV